MNRVFPPVRVARQRLAGRFPGCTAPEQYSEFFEDGQRDGGAVLPGFVLPVRAWFNEAGRQPERECV